MSGGEPRSSKRDHMSREGAGSERITAPTATEGSFLP